jgi:hypothetical protein
MRRGAIVSGKEGGICPWLYVGQQGNAIVASAWRRTGQTLPYGAVFMQRWPRVIWGEFRQKAAQMVKSVAPRRQRGAWGVPYVAKNRAVSREAGTSILALSMRQ